MELIKLQIKKYGYNLYQQTTHGMNSVKWTRTRTRNGQNFLRYIRESPEKDGDANGTEEERKYLLDTVVPVTKEKAATEPQAVGIIKHMLASAHAVGDEKIIEPSVDWL